jgi:hypothetical protein
MLTYDFIFTGESEFSVLIEFVLNDLIVYYIQSIQCGGVGDIKCRNFILQQCPVYSVWGCRGH